MENETKAESGQRPPMDEDRARVADMIEEAGRKLGASIYWNNVRHGVLCTLTLGNQEVSVEAMPHKYGARIASEDGSRYWDYSSVKDLATAVRRRITTAEARDARDEERHKAYLTREERRQQNFKTVQAELVRVVGQDVYDSCLSISTDTETVDVYVDHGKIRGSKMTLAEAVKFVTVLRAAGYKLEAQS